MSGERDTSPDFYLNVKDKLTNGQTRAGCAWRNSQGGLSIKLNPAVVLSAAGLRDCYLTLWPNKRKGPPPGSPASRDMEPETPPDAYIPGDPGDDDIPF